MRRRDVIEMAALGSLTGVSGCSRIVGDRRDDPVLPGGMSVATEHWNDRVLAFHRRRPPDVYENPDSPEKMVNPYPAVFTDGTRARDRLLSREYGHVEEAAEFVDATDFERSYLLVIDWGYASSSDTLVLDRIERSEHDGLHVQMRLEQPDTRLGDASLHTLAIRVTDTKVPFPG